MWPDMLRDTHRRHLVLTLIVGAGLAAYVSGSVTAVYGFDFALVLALAGGFPIFYEAAGGLVQRRISADLAVSLAALAALYIGQYAVAAEVVFIMLVGEALEHFAGGLARRHGHGRRQDVHVLAGVRRRTLLRQAPEIRTGCGNAARTDPRGGPPARAVPTATRQVSASLASDCQAGDRFPGPNWPEGFSSPAHIYC